MRISYEDRVQQSLRSVVADILREVASHGLVGDQHFFISFQPHFPNVNVPPDLKEESWDEVTIVLQHQFWDLNVQNEAFSVGLNFQGKSYTVHIPFLALTNFSDPSADLSLQFTPPKKENTPPSEGLSQDKNVIHVDFSKKRRD